MQNNGAVAYEPSNSSTSESLKCTSEFCLNATSTNASQFYFCDSLHYEDNPMCAFQIPYSDGSYTYGPALSDIITLPNVDTDGNFLEGRVAFG